MAKEAIDYDTLRRLLLTPVVRTLRIADLYLLQDRKAEEVAALMGMSESAVRGVVKRVLRKLAHAKRGENARF